MSGFESHRFGFTGIALEEAFTEVMANGQVVIPMPVCKRLGGKAGDVLRFRVSGDVVTIEKDAEAEDNLFASEANVGRNSEAYSAVP